MESLKVKKELCVILVLTMLLSMFACSMLMMGRISSDEPSGQLQGFAVADLQLPGADRLNSVLHSFKDGGMLGNFLSSADYGKSNFAKFPIVALGLHVFSKILPLKTLRHHLLTIKNKLSTRWRAGIFAWPDAANQLFYQLE